MYEHGSRTYCDRHRDSNSRYHQRCGHCTSALLLLLLLLLLCPLLDGKAVLVEFTCGKNDIVSCANMLLLGVVAICVPQEMQQVQTEFGPLNVFVEVRCVQQHRSKYLLAKKYAAEYDIIVFLCIDIDTQCIVRHHHTRVSRSCASFLADACLRAYTLHHTTHEHYHNLHSVTLTLIHVAMVPLPPCYRIRVTLLHSQ